MVQSTRKRMDGDGVAVHGGATMAAVLGNDNLLHRILVHIDYPTSLICVAMVCKLWLRHVSAPDFIRGRLFVGRYSQLLLRQLRGRYVLEEEEDDATQLGSVVGDRWGVLQEATVSRCHCYSCSIGSAW
ncbi:hypothetical protein ACQ4PT_000712 [Festuca glaucescens]